MPHKGAHHGRRSGASPNRHRVTGAAAETLDRLPTVKEMHLQRVATMAAAAATAQQISADVESHEQFAKELRSYRGQAAGGGARRVTKPTWESDVGEGGAFEAGYPPSGHGSVSGALVSDSQESLSGLGVIMLLLMFSVSNFFAAAGSAYDTQCF